MRHLKAVIRAQDGRARARIHVEYRRAKNDFAFIYAPLMESLAEDSQDQIVRQVAEEEEISHKRVFWIFEETESYMAHHNANHPYD